MPGPDFDPHRRTVDELLAGSDYYLIPRFQRPYSWDTANVDEFWRDALLDNEVGYFIGPMVGWRPNELSPDLYIVDGQQRLTTVVLILAALRNAFSALGNDALADAVHRYLEKPDRENKLRFSLESTEGAPTYLDRVLDRNSGQQLDTARNADDTSKALQAITMRLDEELQQIPTVAKKVRKLRGLRDRVLGLRVIWIEHSNEDDAYVVFETLNTRGKDLEVVDLLKNLLLSLLRRGRNPRADQARDQWNRIRMLIEDSQERLDINRFIQHWWLSHQPFVAQRKLFSAIKYAVRTVPDATQLMNGLEHDAPLYRSIFETSYRVWGPEEEQLQRSLKALAVFGVIQPTPLLLALLRARGNRTVTISQLRLTFATIERFHFQFTAIARQASSGGIGEMYARYARDVSSTSDRHANAQRLAELRQQLVERAPDAATFEAGFVERLVLTDEVNREKRLVQYVLKELLRYSRPNTNQIGTVEHIHPQGGSRKMQPADVGSIGNLLWVSEELNTKLANGSFASKRATLRRYRSYYDVDDIVGATDWGPIEIRGRADQLAQAARRDVWRLPVR